MMTDSDDYRRGYENGMNAAQAMSDAGLFVRIVTACREPPRGEFQAGFVAAFADFIVKALELTQHKIKNEVIGSRNAIR